MELSCKFSYNSSMTYPDKVYVCYVNSASITRIDNRTIRSIVGTHKDGKSDSDVKAIFFHDTVVEFFPHGLHEVFPNLIAVLVQYCRLKEITRHDLKLLQKLESIYLGFNQLTTLPSNLFEDLPRLKRIAFNCNKLEFVRSKLLEPLRDNKLILVDFCGNKNIDSKYMSDKDYSFESGTIEKLKETIDENCKAPEAEVEEETGKKAHEMLVSQQFEKYWRSEKMTDFSFFVGSEELKAHKIILSIHSTVLARWFKTQPENSNVVEIPHFRAQSVHDFLRCLYTGEYPHHDNVLEVFALASKFGVDYLKGICAHIICNLDLNGSSAYKALILGQVFACNKVEVAAFKDIKNMFPGANLPDSLMQQPESVKKLIDYKNGLDAILKSFKRM